MSPAAITQLSSRDPLCGLESRFLKHFTSLAEALLQGAEFQNTASVCCQMQGFQAIHMGKGRRKATRKPRLRKLMDLDPSSAACQLCGLNKDFSDSLPRSPCHSAHTVTQHTQPLSLSTHSHSAHTVIHSHIGAFLQDAVLAIPNGLTVFPRGL